MKTGIDSYCYHRLFGEVYPQQPASDKKWTLGDFLERAKNLDVDGVSLESCFFPQRDKSYMEEIKAMLDEFRFDRVYAWGHPDGLEAGANRREFQGMMKEIEYAKAIGADVMRVVASSLMFRFDPHEPQLKTLIQWFKEAVKKAEDFEVKIAVENHIDYNSNEMLSLIEGVGSPNFGINFDTGNFMRVLDDPIEAMKKLAKYTFATHIKDLKPQKGASVLDWYFFSSTPVGDGLVNNQNLAQILKDHGYRGFLAVEIDFLHPDYNWDEDAAVERSVRELKRITGNLK